MITHAPKPKKFIVQCEYGKFKISIVKVTSKISNKDSKLLVHNLLLILSSNLLYVFDKNIVRYA